MTKRDNKLLIVRSSWNNQNLSFSAKTLFSAKTVIRTMKITKFPFIPSLIHISSDEYVQSFINTSFKFGIPVRGNKCAHFLVRKCVSLDTGDQYIYYISFLWLLGLSYSIYTRENKGRHANTFSLRSLHKFWHLRNLLSDLHRNEQNFWELLSGWLPRLSLRCLNSLCRYMSSSLYLVQGTRWAWSGCHTEEALLRSPWRNELISWKLTAWKGNDPQTI